MSHIPESLSLVRCRDCASPLLQPVSVAGPLNERSLVTRYCPECRRSDVVIADEFAVEIWLRRDAGVMTRMAAAADNLAAELALTESLSASSGAHDVPL